MLAKADQKYSKNSNIWWNPRTPDPPKTTITFKAQKGSKDIIKIVNVTSVVQP